MREAFKLAAVGVTRITLNEPCHLGERDMGCWSGGEISDVNWRWTGLMHGWGGE